MSSEGLSYAAAGVDIEAYERALERVKPLIAATHGKEVAVGVGPFAGLYALAGGGHLAASTDGVGTKIKVAIAAASHRGIGVDIVNHCVNDIATAGARPLFFLDYFATGKLEPDVFTELVDGMTAACRAAGCALLGGETAEMPGVYALGDYDVAGFMVGVVERDRVIDGSRVVAGDAVLGLPSSGLHTNGYSLVRHIAAAHELDWGDVLPGTSAPLADVLLEPHRSYLHAVRELRARADVRALAHITGGGLVDNVPRVLPAGLAADLDRSAWAVPAIFTALQEAGGIHAEEMWRTF